MSKVYVLIVNVQYECSDVLGVYSSRKLAETQKAAAENSSEYCLSMEIDIEEYKLDE